MKKNKYIILSAAMLMLAGSVTTSCSDFLDKEYDASLSSDKVFSDETQTRGFLANIYTNLPDGFAPLTNQQYTGASRDCMTDNATTSWGLHYYPKICTDTYTAADHPLLGFWNTDLYGIRKANQFMKQAQKSVIGNNAKDGDDNFLYDRYMAEARLLRAIFHFDLICWFGDCPIIGDEIDGVPIVFDTSDTEGMNMERTPAAEALEWVVSECDKVKDVLPFRYADEASNWGRVNGAAAYALKSRALLYRASALYNPSNDKQLWKNAADAAQAFIQKNKQQSNPYALLTSSDKSTAYYNIFSSATNPTQNPEFILARSVWNSNTPELVFLPVGFTGSFSGNGRTNPTQNFVDCFEMANGKHIDEAESGYDEQHPYDNRDPRLDQIVFHHNSVWGVASDGEQRSIDVSSNTGGAGIDYNSSMGGTYTGYYLKKFVNNISCKNPSTFQHAWPIFRFTEIYLNLAEALNEAEGPVDSVYFCVNAIRDRVGMPAYEGMSQSELRERIRNERRIELSFEDHRFFDVRRWKLYDEATSTSETGKPRYEQIYNLYGVRVTGDDVVGAPVYTYGKSETNNSIVFNSPKNYYFPIPSNEVKRAPKLGQNPGWEVAGDSSSSGDSSSDNSGSTE